jgi:hypothetical protein
MKSSRSEDNAMYMTRKSIPSNDQQQKSSGRRAICRSESSPRLSARRSPERYSRSPSPDISSYYAEDESACPTHRGRSPSRKPVGHGHLYEKGDPVGIPFRTPPPNSHTAQYFRSPAHIITQTHSQHPPSTSSCPNRHMPKSPTRILSDVPEREECDIKIIDADLLADPSPNSPKKRSRSPMKKIFGEHGLLGRSPDELEAVKLKSKKSSLGQKGTSSVMGKLRTRIGELVSPMTII